MISSLGDRRIIYARPPAFGDCPPSEARQWPPRNNHRHDRAGPACAQVAQQLQAVESAIENAKKALIHEHISHGLERSLEASGSKGRAALREFKLIAKYL